MWKFAQENALLGNTLRPQKAYSSFRHVQPHPPVVKHNKRDFFLQNPSLITIFQNLAQNILLYHDKYKRIQKLKVCSIKNDQVWEKSQCWVFKWTATRQKPKSIKSTQNARGDWNGGMMLTVYI